MLFFRKKKRDSNVCSHRGLAAKRLKALPIASPIDFRNGQITYESRCPDCKRVLGRMTFQAVDYFWSGDR